MKRIAMIVAAVLCLFVTDAALAASQAVLVDYKGTVTVTAPGKKTLKPKTGLALANGTVVAAGAGGSATVLLKDGRMVRVTSATSYKVGTKSTSQTSSVRGITVALNEVSTRGATPRAQGMVKAAAAPMVMTPDRKAQMAADLKKIDTMGLGDNGAKLMYAQVYYKYRQYDQALKPLLELYNAEKPPSPLVVDLIGLYYEKMGNYNEAKKYTTKP